MRSTHSTEDRTTRARIRDAAIARFGESGFDKATVREIAAAAGVSPALVLHHFGSKEGLRAACDEFVVARFKQGKEEAVRSGSTDPLAALAGYADAVPHLRYLSRALGDGTPAAARLFDDMVRESEEVMALGVEAGMLKPSRHPYDQAVVLVAWQLGGLVLFEHVARRFGGEAFATEVAARYTRAAVEVLTEGTFADTRFEDAWESVDFVDERPPPEGREQVDVTDGSDDDAVAG